MTSLLILQRPSRQLLPLVALCELTYTTLRSTHVSSYQSGSQEMLNLLIVLAYYYTS